MKNYNLLKVDNEKFSMLVVMQTYEAPFQYLDDISDYLKEERYNGYVLIDELLHSGNNEERFISGYFDGKKFDLNTFSFERIARQDLIREYSDKILSGDPDIINYSILNNVQKKLLNSGRYI